ncbi:hypothetical protein O181_012914 [Austropuccinia psidii MF-1]|uniref:RNA-directed DNA polymerase n=1 Tax=Austropuccinia psidii MF-1 TaxID=1389203 RepID=A0A9Q3GNB8_9BASI|nr:hypothetical protein [Austropuccinia psidii MF-1]
MSDLPEKIPLFILDSNESPPLFITNYTKWVVDLPSFPSFEWDFFIIDSPKGEDLILGYDFFYHFNPIIDWKNGLITYDSSNKDSSGIIPSTSNDFTTAVNSVALVGELKTPSLPSSVHIPSIIPSQSLVPLRDDVFKEIKDVEEDVAISSLHLFQGDMDLPTLSFHASLEEQWDEEEEPEEIETVLKRNFLNTAPVIITLNWRVYLPPIGVIYSLSNQESETLRAYISENVEEVFIRPSSSSTGEPAFFVKKKDGGLCLCVDYRKLNAVTRKNRYPVPPMKQLLTVFTISTIFSKIDLHGAYNLLRIKEGDEHLTAFRTKYGSYECLVMPFGLTNAPASFQNLVNGIFADFLDVFVVAYLDDIMVFSSSEEEHVKHVTSVLQRLRDKNLFSKASKCVFNSSSVEYLGYVVSSDGLKMDSSKEALSQFQLLKEAFTTAPILAHFNPSLPTIVDTDASDYALGAVLSQLNDSGKHPIGFDSCKLLPNELNYEIYDKELLVVFWALKRWRAFLLSCSNPFEVLTDHSSLQYFMSSKVLTNCQAHWAEFLSEFHFNITYRPGRMATLPDALLHWNNVYPERGVNFISKNPQNFHQVIKQDGIQESRFFSIKVKIFSDLIDKIQKEVWQDNDSKEILKQLARDSPVGNLSKKLQSVQQVVKEELESAIRRLKKYADRNRAIPPDFQPGDKVRLAPKNIKTTRPTKKLSERWLGPFEVIKKIGSHAYHLKLPQQWKSVHPVFHVSLLEPVKQSAIPNRNQLPPPPVLVEEKQEWEVAQVLDSKLKRGKLWYLVEWKGFSEDPERTSWEPAFNITNSPYLVKDFHSLYPGKPGPNTSEFDLWCLVGRRSYESKFLSWNAL